MEEEPIDSEDLDESNGNNGVDFLPDQDLPCIRCAYNLRGLQPENQCPECGAPIRETLEFAAERMLCTACMRPNHPSVQICRHCSAPISGAASVAAYYQTAAIGVRDKSIASSDSLETPPSVAMTLLTWFFGLPLFFLFFRLTFESLSDRSSYTALFSYFVIAAGILGGMIVMTWSHNKAFRAYQKRNEPDPKDTGDADDTDDIDGIEIDEITPP